MMKRRGVVIFFAMLLLLSPMLAAAQGVVVGGYDVAKIAAATIEVLQEKKVLPDAEARALGDALAAIRADDPLVAAGPIVDLYGAIFERLVARNVVATEEVAAAKAAAAKSGGVKAAGLNPLILAAACLDLMAQKGLISLAGAQQILDAAKRPIPLTGEQTKG